MKLVYLVGEPGAGKTTLMAALTAGYGTEEELWPTTERHHRGPRLRYVRLAPGMIELGRRRAEFSGTDALGMAVMPTALNYLAQTDEALIVGEGDRLATRAFLDAGAARGAVTLAILATSPTLCAERRAARGSTQSPEWVKGRRTKVYRLVRNWPGRLLILDDPRTDLERLRAEIQWQIQL